jgi:UDP-glucose 4-epimerase
MSTVAVTGSTGFVGRRLVAAARAHHEVVELGRDRIDLSRVDLAEAARLLEGVDTVCHLAAYIPRDLRDPDEAAACMQVNALGSLSLVRAAGAAGVARFVYVSSGNVYRPQPQAVSEDAPVYPSERAPYYLGSKVAGELYVDHAVRTGAIGGAIARVSSVYGPGMTGSGMLPTFVNRIRAGQGVRLEDGGRYRADLVYVDDVVDGLLRMLERDVSGIFNLGAGEAPTSLEVAETLVDLLGRDRELLEVQPVGTSLEAPGFSPLAIERAQRELGYQPRSLREGLRAHLEAEPA